MLNGATRNVYGGFSIDVDITNEDEIRLVLHGELDLARRHEVLDVLASLEVGEELPTVVVDTADLHFIDSVGLGLLVEARNRFGPERFVLVPGDATIRVLEAAGIKSHLLGD